MGRFGEKSVSLYCSKHFMTQHSPYMAPDEVHYVPVGVMPWPVRNNDVWLVTGVLVKDCLDLTIDLIPSFAMKGYQLRSFPLLLGQLTAKELRYNFPGQKLGIGDLNEIEFRKNVATALGLEMNPAAGYFIRKHPAEEGFLVIELQASTHQKFLLAASTQAVQDAVQNWADMIRKYRNHRETLLRLIDKIEVGEKKDRGWAQGAGDPDTFQFTTDFITSNSQIG